MRRLIRRVALVLASLLGLALVAVAVIDLRFDANRPLGYTITAPPLPSPAPADPAAPVLILLHGAGLNGHMWDAFRRSLDPRWRVLAPDLPGHGQRHAERFTLDGAVAAVAAAARSVAPSPVVLVGDSLGGYCAMAVASSLPPEQLRGLVLAGSSSNMDDANPWRQVAVKTFARVMISLRDERAAATRAVTRMGLDAADVKRIVDAGVNLRAWEQAVQGLKGRDFRTTLASIPQPVLIVNGSLDTSRVEQEPAFLAVAQRGSTHRFGNTEHGVSMRRSADFAHLVDGFATRVTQAPASAPR